MCLEKYIRPAEEKKKEIVILYNEKEGKDL